MRVDRDEPEVEEGRSARRSRPFVGWFEPGL
jgi:hypothetical protein